VASDEDMIEQTATSLASGEAVGWMQGRMEFGPRALGARSILGDPRSPTMQKAAQPAHQIPRKLPALCYPRCCARTLPIGSSWTPIRPICCSSPVVRPERRRAMSSDEEALFGIDKLNVVRSEIPAVTHIDYSARIQTVHADTNARFHSLIERFKTKTGCPVLVNTSFNVRSEPIVCTPEDAFRCFMEATSISSSSAIACCARRIRTRR